MQVFHADDDIGERLPHGDTGMLRGRTLDNELLRAFVAVVDYGGFSAAASGLHRTQAAVSHQIKRLEEATQAALFRHPRRLLQLTPQGKVLLDCARRLIALNDQALNSLRADDLGGKVRIGANHHYATEVLPPLLKQFSRLHPDIQIELHTGLASELDKRLGSMFDLVINVHETGCGEGHLLRRSPLVWATSALDSPHALDPVPLVLLPVGSLLRRLATDRLAAAGRSWRLVQESANVAVIRATVEAGLAITPTHSLCGRTSIRPLRPDEGFPSLPIVDLRLQTADRFIPRAAARLHGFLRDTLTQPKADSAPSRTAE